MLKAIGDLKGKTVKNAFIAHCEGQRIPVIIFTDGSSIAAWQDEERNGPGTLRWSSKGMVANALLVDDDNPYIGKTK